MFWRPGVSKTGSSVEISISHGSNHILLEEVKYLWWLYLILWSSKNVNMEREQHLQQRRQQESYIKTSKYTTYDNYCNPPSSKASGSCHHSAWEVWFNASLNFQFICFGACEQMGHTNNQDQYSNEQIIKHWTLVLWNTNRIMILWHR